MGDPVVEGAASHGGEGLVKQIKQGPCPSPFTQACGQLQGPHCLFVQHHELLGLQKDRKTDLSGTQLQVILEVIKDSPCDTDGEIPVMERDAAMGTQGEPILKKSESLLRRKDPILVSRDGGMKVLLEGSNQLPSLTEAFGKNRLARADPNQLMDQLIARDFLNEKLSRS